MENDVCVAELTQAYYTILHHQNFRSNDCSSKLFGCLFHDSNIVRKYSSGTKVKSLVTIVLVEHSLTSILEEIKSEDIYFYGIGTDTGNHKAIKVFTFVIQYFTVNHGLQYKLLKVRSLPNETSDTISKFCEDVINEGKVEKKNCVAFCGDNCNTSFVDVMRRRRENVFAKLKIIIHVDIQSVGCTTHIMHTCTQMAADTLDCDIEVIVFKIYSYFSIYTVRNEQLGEFCDFVDTEYKVLLSTQKLDGCRYFHVLNVS